MISLQDLLNAAQIMLRESNWWKSENTRKEPNNTHIP